MDIIATIGPSSANKKVLYGLISNGVNIIRLNFSHFFEDQFFSVISDSRSIKSDIEIMGDISGRKIRVYEKINQVYKVYENEEVFFCGEDVYDIILKSKNDSTKIIPLTIKSSIIKENNINFISMKDGSMNFDIIDKDKMFLKAKSLDDGIIRGGKGCNIPGLIIKNRGLSERDRNSLKWCVKNNINIISQSYVESNQDIYDVKKYIDEIGGDSKSVKIFSKLETSEGVRNYKEILDVSNAIIIARGDLVPECGVVDAVSEEFDLLKNIKHNNYEGSIIVATHILDSMKNGKIANINEVEGIYNFLKLGVDGFLLAGETSVGRNPISSVKFLTSLIEKYKL